MTDTPLEEEFELSEEEFEVDPSAEDVDVAEVETTGSQEVATQDPEARQQEHGDAGGAG